MLQHVKLRGMLSCGEDHGLVKCYIMARCEGVVSYARFILEVFTDIAARSSREALMLSDTLLERTSSLTNVCLAAVTAGNLIDDVGGVDESCRGLGSAEDVPEGKI